MAEVDGEDDSGEEKQSAAHTGDGDDVYFKVEAVKLQAQLSEASSGTSFDSKASHALRLKAANGFRGNSGWIQVGYNNEVRFNWLLYASNRCISQGSLLILVPKL
jgi:hypothetical protein